MRSYSTVFKELQMEFDFIGEVRALGLIGAIEMVHPVTKQRFDSFIAPRVSEEAAKRGLIVRTVVFERDGYGRFFTTAYY